jgi:hypothetical protein
LPAEQGGDGGGKTALAKSIGCCFISPLVWAWESIDIFVFGCMALARFLAGFCTRGCYRIPRLLGSKPAHMRSNSTPLERCLFLLYPNPDNDHQNSPHTTLGTAVYTKRCGEAVIGSCCKSCFVFTDNEFPPNAKSMGKWNNKTEAEIDNEVVWCRAHELFPEWSVQCSTPPPHCFRWLCVGGCHRVHPVLPKRGWECSGLYARNHC